jgi:hypothetical protein
VITNIDEQRDKERQVRQIAEQIAVLLNRIEDLGAGPANGQINVPAARIRFIRQWEVTN